VKRTAGLGRRNFVREADASRRWVEHWRAVPIMRLRDEGSGMRCIQ